MAGRVVVGALASWIAILKLSCFGGPRSTAPACTGMVSCWLHVEAVFTFTALHHVALAMLAAALVIKLLIAIFELIIGSELAIGLWILLLVIRITVIAVLRHVHRGVLPGVLSRLWSTSCHHLV